MSLNIKRKNNFQKSKSSNELISTNLNDLFSGKGNLINDELDKDYINHCIKLSRESRFQKSKETERNKLLKRCRICRNCKNNENLIFCSICKDAFHYKCLDKDEKDSETEKSLKKYYECKRCIKTEEEKDKILKYKQLKLDEAFFNGKNSIGKKNNNNSQNNNKNILTDSKAIICHKCNKIIKDKSLSSTCEKPTRNWQMY